MRIKLAHGQKVMPMALIDIMHMSHTLLAKLSPELALQHILLAAAANDDEYSKSSSQPVMAHRTCHCLGAHLSKLAQIS